MPAPLPASCRLSAVGIRFLGHPAPAEEVEPSYGRSTGDPSNGPQRGCRVAHEQDPTGQGAPLTPGTMVRSRPATTLRPAPATQSLRPHSNIHQRGSPSRGVIRVSITFAHRPTRLDAVWDREATTLPAGLLLAHGSRMEREPLRLRLRASHPTVTHRARRGGDRPSRTGPSNTPSTSAEPPNGASYFTHAPSRRT